MIELTETQFELICQKIEEKGLSYHTLEEELMDHYACVIEQEMANGQSFASAFDLILGDKETDQFLLIQAETISLLTYKSSVMKRIGLSTCIIFMAACFIFSLYIGNNIDQEIVYAETTNIPEPALNPDAIWVSQMAPPSRSPLNVPPSITSRFGMRLHPVFKRNTMHKGIDFRAAKGTPVYATANGLVEKVVTQYGYGKLIIIKHDEIYQTYYAQLSTFEVEVGQAVNKGDLIGKVGSSGLSTAPHLHYEVLKNGKPVNPEKYL